MAEPAVDRVVVSRLEARAERVGVLDAAPEVSHWYRGPVVAGRRREVVLVAGVTFIDQSQQSRVAQTCRSVENRQRSVGTKIAHQVRVLESSRLCGDWHMGTGGGQRSHGAPTDDGREKQRAVNLDDALPWEWAGVPDLSGTRQPRQGTIDDPLGQLVPARAPPGPRGP